jgi:uncharacterized membrane protein
VELGRSHPFFLEKLPMARPRLWLLALYVHVPSALMALPACVALQHPRLRRRAPGLHRKLGRITGGLVLCCVVPSGMYLAPFARGGLASVLGFWLTGAIAWLAMLGSVRAARAGNVRAHRRYSVHVTAQLSVAVFSRLLLVASESVGLHRPWVYVAALWLPVSGAVVLAEWSTGLGRPAKRKGMRDEEDVVGISGLDLVG